MTEETLGKRIAAHRKKLSLTQDALAEKLGVTAQAVSKWENDQSCPDISLLPVLANIFGITVDALLGVAREERSEPETAEMETQIIKEIPVITKIPGRHTGVGVAVWLMLTGAVLLLSRLTALNPMDTWEALGLTGLTVFGLWGLFPKFPLFRLGCALAGGYYTYVQLLTPAVTLNRELLIPGLLVCFGLSLLVDTFRKRKKTVICADPDCITQRHFTSSDTTFSCSTTFGEEHRELAFPVLEGGRAEVAFGDLGLDFHDCAALGERATLSLKCAFGKLTIYIPRRWQLQCSNKSFFGSVREEGSPAEDAVQCLRLENEVAFGEITIRYL